jgi:hypothetical protein
LSRSTTNAEEDTVTRHNIISVAVALVVVLACGCSGSSPQRAPVSGTVKVDGRPLERGVITFIPVEGTQGPGAGGEITDGEFALDQAAGAVVGTNRIEIRGFRKTGRKINVMGSTIDEEIQAVPAEYNDKSTLTRPINDGANGLDFDLPGISKKQASRLANPS